MLCHSILVFPTSNKHILGFTPPSDESNLDKWIGFGNRTYSNTTKLFANKSICAIQLERNTIVCLI